jgi:hypothetical protein
VRKLKRLWEKTGDVEKLRKAEEVDAAGEPMKEAGTGAEAS